MDRCHRDGSLKNAVAADPAKYIHEAGLKHSSSFALQIQVPCYLLPHHAWLHAPLRSSHLPDVASADRHDATYHVNTATHPNLHTPCLCMNILGITCAMP